MQASDTKGIIEVIGQVEMIDRSLPAIVVLPARTDSERRDAIPVKPVEYRLGFRAHRVFH